MESEYRAIGLVDNALFDLLLILGGFSLLVVGSVLAGMLLSYWISDSFDENIGEKYV